MREGIKHTHDVHEISFAASRFMYVHTSKLTISGKDEKRINEINLKEMVNKMHGTVREEPRPSEEGATKWMKDGSEVPVCHKFIT